MRRATPLADGDTMPQPHYMDVGSAGTPGLTGSARFVVTELGLIDTATIVAETTPELTAEPRAKLVDALPVGERVIGPVLGLVISIAAIGFGVTQLRRGDRTNGRLAIALGVVGLVLNLYALFVRG